MNPNSCAKSEAPIPIGQTVRHSARSLSQEEIRRLENDKKLVSEFKQMKLENEARKNWDLFYKRNTTNFFKDRHWTSREFYELSVEAEANAVRP